MSRFWRAARRRRTVGSLTHRLDGPPPGRWLVPDDQEPAQEREAPAAPLVTQGVRGEAPPRRRSRRWLRDHGTPAPSPRLP